MATRFSLDKTLPITAKPITSPSDKATYQDVLNILNTLRILTGYLEQFTLDNAGIGDAPEDAGTYVRSEGTWKQLAWGQIAGALQHQADLATELAARITEAPLDSKSYVRNNGAWLELEQGTEATFERTASDSISALVVVWEDELGEVRPLDALDGTNIPLLCGLTITSASAGQPVTIQRSGQLDVTDLGLSPGHVWLGLEGRMTQTPPDDGFDVLVGYVISPQRMYLDFSQAISL